MERTLFWGLFAFLLSWMIASAVGLTMEDGNLFQRSGALGIASAILLFGYQKGRVVKLFESLGDHHIKSLRSEFELEAMEMQNISNLNFVYLLQSLKSGSEDSHLREKLEEIQGRTTASDAKISEMRRETDALRADDEILKTRASKIQSNTIWSELVVVALATIQTGFGDIFVRLISGV